MNDQEVWDGPPDAGRQARADLLGAALALFAVAAAMAARDASLDSKPPPTTKVIAPAGY